MTAKADDSMVEASPLQGGQRTRVGDLAVRVFVTACGGFVVLTTLLLLGFIARTGVKGFAEVGIPALLSGELWKPEADTYGGLPLVVGTLVTAIGAVFVGAAPAVLAAVWLTELAPKRVVNGYRRMMEISAAVPSVVYGWLALVYLVPQMGMFAVGIHGADAAVGGEGLATSALLLGIMIAPTVMLLSLDALSRDPSQPRAVGGCATRSRACRGASRRPARRWGPRRGRPRSAW